MRVNGKGKDCLGGAKERNTVGVRRKGVSEERGRDRTKSLMKCEIFGSVVKG